MHLALGFRAGDVLQVSMATSRSPRTTMTQVAFGCATPAGTLTLEAGLL